MSQKAALQWNPENTPVELHPMLTVLAEEYPLQAGDSGGGKSLEFERGGEPGALAVECGETAVRIRYGSVPAALRGVGHALATENRASDCSFETLGIMLDCSRNAVMKPAYIKRWLRRLALLGYNRLMLYTEDVYRLPGEPLFGYKRGAYTADELREIDAYAASLGIEVIGCIQTLGHLEQLFKWDAYKEIEDTEFNLRVDKERSYELIEKMLKFWADVLGTRRIHIGMDEATYVGRGKFMNANGYVDQFELFNKHLEKVCTMCEQHGLKPMIWSDMYFRLGSANHDYYDRNAVIPAEVKERIPESVDLVYWDYYTKDEEFYVEWIRRHRELGKEPIMASGIWTWLRFWYDHSMTASAAAPCIRACRKTKVKDIWFTMWGDGGSYCDFDSSLAGIAYAADLAFGGSGEADSVSPAFRSVCGGDYAMQLIGNDLRTAPVADGPIVASSTPLWDDALLGIGWEGYQAAGDDFWNEWLAKLRDLREEITPHRANHDVGDMNYLWTVCNSMILKVELRKAIIEAYPNDKEALKRIQMQSIPKVIAALEEMEMAFRTQWLRRNKVFGMETLQVRLGGVRSRLSETARRIGEFLDGSIDGIEELDTDYGPVGLNPVAYYQWLVTGSIRI